MKGKFSYSQNKVFSHEGEGVVVSKGTATLKENITNKMDKLLAEVVSRHVGLEMERTASGRATCSEHDKFDYFKGKDIAAGRMRVALMSKTADQIISLQKATAEYLYYLDDLLQGIVEDYLPVRDKLEGDLR